MHMLTNRDLDEIEISLGLPLPEDVRDQYSLSNGLIGPAGCQLLFTYKKTPELDIVFNNTLHDLFPQSFRSTILLGNDGCGNSICWDCSAREAILWNPADGEYVQIRRPTVKEIWACVEALYDELD
jgi:hypothetical protein